MSLQEVAKKRVRTIETPPDTVANIMKLFTIIDKDADGRIMSHDMGKHLYAINRLYKLLHDLPVAVRGFTDTDDIIAHFDENEDGELNFQEFLKGMTEAGAFEKVAKKSMGKHSSTSRALDNAISGIKDTLLDSVSECNLAEVKLSLKGLTKLYNKSTSSHKSARRFRDLLDAVRCIPRRMLGFASALAVLDTLHEYLRQDAATIITRFMRLNRDFRSSGEAQTSIQKWAATFSRVQNIERRRQKQATIYRRNKRRAEKNAKDKAASYLQSLFRGRRARRKYRGQIERNLQARKAEKEAAEEARRKKISEDKKRAIREKLEREKVFQRLSQDTADRNPFQTKYMSTYTNLQRPRLGRFITGGIKEAIHYNQARNNDSLKKVAALLSPTSTYTSSHTPSKIQALPSPMIMHNFGPKQENRSGPTIKGTFTRGIHGSPMKESILSLPLDIKSRSQQNTRPSTVSNDSVTGRVELSESVRMQFKEAGLYGDDEKTRASRRAKERGKMSINRATVGTSKDKWKDEHNEVYASSRYVTDRNKQWMKQISSVYSKKIPRPSRKKPIVGSNTTGRNRNITPSPRKRRAINALDNARRFMRTR